MILSSPPSSGAGGPGGGDSSSCGGGCGGGGGGGWVTLRGSADVLMGIYFDNLLGEALSEVTPSKPQHLLVILGSQLRNLKSVPLEKVTPRQISSFNRRAKLLGKRRYICQTLAIKDQIAKALPDRSAHLNAILSDWQIQGLDESDDASLGIRPLRLV